MSQSRQRRSITVSDLENLNLSRQLIERGMRLSLIGALTDVSIGWLRDAYRDIHGEQAKPGKTPESCLPFLGRIPDRAQCSSFASFYRSVNGDYAMSAERLITTADSFQRVCGEFDINAAYFVCRDLHAGLITSSWCDDCNLTYIPDTPNRRDAPCPFCRISAKTY